MSLGTKLIDDPKSAWCGQRVRIDSVLLPEWSGNAHHFIQQNYLALESIHMRQAIHNWIDLVFGKNQQKQECFNLFRPLSSEKYVEEREKTKSHKLDIGEIVQITEFGHNPAQLFDKSQKIFKEKAKKPVLDSMIEESHYKYQATFISQHKKEDNALRVIPHGKNTILVVYEHELHKVIITGGNECKVQSRIKLQPFYSILEKTTFINDPQTTIAYANDYLVTCRHPDNTFILYSTTNFSRIQSVAFHLNTVNVVQICEKSHRLYTGDMDGVVACWDIDELAVLANKCPKVYYADHSKPIIGIASNYELDLYASTSIYEAVLRVASTNKFFKRVRPLLFINGIQYKTYSVILSARGYLVLHLRSLYIEYKSDSFIVYSINGELVGSVNIGECINSWLFDHNNYFLVTGGTNKKLRQFNIITMEERELQGKIGTEFPAAVLSMEPAENGSIVLLLEDKSKVCIDYFENNAYIIYVLL